MNSTAQALINLYKGDLKRLSAEVEAISEEKLWQASPGIINSCGVLTQHLIGNLRHFIGTEIGKTDFVRNRELEFSNTGISCDELKKRIDSLRQMIEEVLSSLQSDDLQASRTGQFPYENSLQQGLIHLYGHLNYHLGQVNYLRRMIEEKG